MKRGKLLLAFVLLSLFAWPAYSQSGARMPRKNKLEFGVFAGASNYEGTLEQNIANVEFTEPGVGLLARYNFNNKFALRFGMDYGTIEDADSVATDPWRTKRNLSFKTTILDGYLAAEYYFATIANFNKKFTQFYIFGGIGSFHFNPQALYQGRWYNLQPLGTEGQGTQEYPNRVPYQLNQVYLPMGIGVRFELSTYWHLNFELRGNKTFTDYLDDVSLTYASPDVLMAQGGPVAVALANRTAEKFPNETQDVTGQYRGGKDKTDDWFYFTGFILSYTLHPKYHCYTF